MWNPQRERPTPGPEAVLLAAPSPASPPEGHALGRVTGTENGLLLAREDEPTLEGRRVSEALADDPPGWSAKL